MFFTALTDAYCIARAHEASPTSSIRLAVFAHCLLLDTKRVALARHRRTSVSTLASARSATQDKVIAAGREELL